MTGNIILWIGGSSALARSYCNCFAQHDENEDGDPRRSQLVLLGLEASAPHWLKWKNISYISCDLAELSDNSDQWPGQLLALLQKGIITSIIVGIRPPLVYWNNDYIWNQSQKMLFGLDHILQFALLKNDNIHCVVHVSSVAAVNHLEPQIMQKEQEHTSKALIAPYDRFKRQTEIIMDSICKSANVPCIHLRISAIFSDDKSCIQCSALQLQLYCVPKNMLVRIDCNSGRNVAQAIRLILFQSKQRTREKADGSASSTYYYTRPTEYTIPVTYAQYLKHFRTAHQIPAWAKIPFPYIWMHYIVVMVNWLSTSWGGCYVPFLKSINYLLQVSNREHTFDNTRFQYDYPQIYDKEESILQCFVRRRMLLLEQEEKHLTSSGR